MQKVLCLCLTWYRCGLVNDIKWRTLDIKLLFQLSTDELPAHTHQEKMTTGDGNSNPIVNLETSGTLRGATVPQRFGYSTTATAKITTEAVGGDQPHNNMPPSIACYGWRRTA